MVLTKEEFNKLILLEQVEYINNMLQETSLTKATKAIGIDRKTVSKRFESKGYELIKNKYINTVNTVDTTGTDTITTDKTQSIEIANKKVREKSQCNSNTKGLEQRVQSLEKELGSIKSILKDMSNTTNTIATNTVDTSNTLKRYEGNTVSRNYRINEDVQKEFKKYCKTHSEYNVGDIMTNALEQFLNNNK